MLLKQKRGIGMIGETVVFILVNLAVIIVLLLAISRIDTSSTLTEQAYAKQTALLINGAKQGTIITEDITELYQIAQRNGIAPTITIDCEKNEIFIKATNGPGYKHVFFTKLDKCNYILDAQKRSLTIIV